MRSTLLLAVGATALTLISLPLAAAPAPAAAATASNWQAISAEPGKRIEIDRSSIKKDASGKTTAWGRVILDRELHDAKSGGAYKIIEAMNRYDCEARAYATVKRVYLKNEGEILREEDTGAQSELPARAGTLDEKLLREVCRPQSPSDLAKVAQKTTDKITAATYDLKQANEERLKKEAEKDKRKGVKADKADADEMAPPVLKPRVRSSAPRPLVKKAAPAKSDKGSDKASDKAGHEESAGDKHEHSALQAHWAYEGEGGPEKWGSLSTDYSTCAKGQRQSPIDIRDGIRVDLPTIKFDYQPSMFRIVDNGHTIQVAVGGGSITLMGKTYELVQFHFHRPSEERINGQAYDMVAHLVHKSADGKLAVVAVLLEIGKPNPVIKTLWDYMPLERNDEVAPTDIAIDLNQLLPPAPSRSYFTYMGSLTTPPCTEGVLWMVLKEPMTVSAEQNSIFARLYRNNARPIQPVNGRLIKESR
jgi:carbonic anhydrase